MLTRKKYRLLQKEEVLPNTSGWNSSKKLAVHRIQALRNIPAHGVKRGDIGGYVTSLNTLSQDGSCWIGYHAAAMGNVEIRDDAYLGDKAIAICDFSDSMILIQDSARICDNARVTISKSTDDESPSIISRISGQAMIFGNAKVSSVQEVSGHVRIFDDALISFAQKISGSVEVKGRAMIRKGVTAIGKSVISEDSVINEDAKIIDCIVRGKAQIGKKQTVSGGDFHEEGIFMSPSKEVPEIIIGQPSLSKGASTKPITLEVKTKAEKVLDLFAGITADIASYETDIVKIIKYPVMTDRTDPHTLKMTKLRKKAERLADSPADPEFEETVSELEDAFLAAESNALKLASTLLSEAELKKTEKARDLLAIAADEGSSENERKVSFKQAFKNLEGVIAVPEVAVDAFRIKIGFKELEV
jgi:carbonic anhydrase/acetyltransferase-like protein (isoleucine patch superfamily)